GMGAGRRPPLARNRRGGRGPGAGMTIRVLLVDDEALVRGGLRMILESADAVRRDRPDVVLMDVRMPGLDGLSAAAQVLQLPEPPRVVILTTFGLDQYVFAALEAGASGFLLKDTPP